MNARRDSVGVALGKEATMALGIAFVATTGMVALCAAKLSLGADAPLRSLCLFIVMAVLVRGGLHAHPHSRFGAANTLTLFRACFAVVLAGFINEPDSAFAFAWPLVAGATVVACCDAVDGRLARASGLESAFGARFDMEVDAVFMLILSVLAFQQDKAGIWIVAIGAMRYAFVAAGWCIKALRQELQPSTRRQTVCVVQVVALIICVMPTVNPPVSEATALFALCLLIYSFGRDIHWLMRSEKSQENST